MRRVLLLLLALALLAGCGGGDSDQGSDAGSTPSTRGEISFQADDFGDWQEAAEQTAGIDCQTPQFVFGDTGEVIREEGDEDKVTSKRQPAFQCAAGLPFFWATVKSDAGVAKADSDATKVAEGFSGVKVVDAPATAPDGATCVAYKKEKRFTCYLPYENLALMASSTKSLDDAAASIAGGLEIVKSATS